MKVLLDTNIVLNGAFNRYTVARDLINTTDSLNFYISYSSIREVDILLISNCTTRKQRDQAARLVQKYLQNLGCIILSPGDPILSLEIIDIDDRPIISTAKENFIDIICSYNIHDIISYHGAIKTPLELVRQHSHNILNHIFQINGRKIGTIFSVIQPYHKSSVGDLFSTNDGAEYFFNNDGHFSSTNSNYPFRVINEIAVTDRIGLIIRSKKNFFEVSCWTPDKDNEWYHGNRFNKSILAYGNSDFEYNIDFKLATNTGKRHFSGHVINISLVPNFIKEHQIQKALGAMCLDVLYGSINLKKLLKEMEFMS